MPRQQCSPTQRQVCDTIPAQSCQQVPQQNCQQVGRICRICQRVFLNSITHFRFLDKAANKYQNKTVKVCQSKLRISNVDPSQENNVRMYHNKNVKVSQGNHVKVFLCRWKRESAKTYPDSNASRYKISINDFLWNNYTFAFSFRYQSQYQGNNVKVCQSKNVQMCQGNNVPQYQGNNVHKCQGSHVNLCHASKKPKIVEIFQGNNVTMFPNRSAELYQSNYSQRQILL